MKQALIIAFSVFSLSATLTTANAADPDAPPSNWREILDQMRQRQEKLERTVEQQQKRIEQLEGGKPAAPTEPTDTPPLRLTQRDRWSPAQPISLFRQEHAHLNLGFVSNVIVGGSSRPDPSAFLHLGHHDPKRRGFNVTGTKLEFDGAIEPYFESFASIGLALEPNGETEIELEEAYLQTTSLPANLQLRAGQFLAEFGRHNALHQHAWDFVDQPIILNRLFGPDGLRSQGARVSWLMPTPFYAWAMLGVFNPDGETQFSFGNEGEDDGAGTMRLYGRATMPRGVRNVGDMLYVPRFVTTFSPTKQQTLALGVSGAFGPNFAGANTRTQIYGADLFWKWRSADAEKGFPFLAWQTEALYRRFETDSDPTVPLAGGKLEDWGFYSQLTWGFRSGWVAGLRGEFASATRRDLAPSEPLRFDRTRVSPNLTWYPSEFSKIRLQYNYDWIQRTRGDHTLWLQFEFSLGGHEH